MTYEIRNTAVKQIAFVSLYIRTLLETVFIYSYFCIRNRKLFKFSLINYVKFTVVNCTFETAFIIDYIISTLIIFHKILS